MVNRQKTQNLHQSVLQTDPSVFYDKDRRAIGNT